MKTIELYLRYPSRVQKQLLHFSYQERPGVQRLFFLSESAEARPTPPFVHSVAKHMNNTINTKNNLILKNTVHQTPELKLASIIIFQRVN